MPHLDRTIKTISIAYCFTILGCLGSSETDNTGINSDDNKLVIADIKINPRGTFQFTQDSDARSDKVVGTLDFTLSDLNNNRFIRDLNNSNMHFEQRIYGSEDTFVADVEATQSSDIDIVPIDVVYLIDNSFSVVQAAAGEALIEQANSLATQMSAQNTVVGDGASQVNFRLFADTVGPMTSVAPEGAFSNIEFEARGGGTALFEAIQVALNDLRQAAQPALFVFTDGRENASAPGYDLDGILDTTALYDIPVYIVGLGDVDNSALSTIANSSGGKFFLANNVNELDEVFEDILGSIPVNYTVTYKPTQRTGHIEFKFFVEYDQASDAVIADFNVDNIIGRQP